MCEGRSRLSCSPETTLVLQDHVSTRCVVTSFDPRLGKARLIKHGQSVLIAFSGGSSSTALVDLVRQGLDEDNHHRKLTFVPSIIHIDGECSGLSIHLRTELELHYFVTDSAITDTTVTTVNDELIRLATETGWSCYICDLSESFRSEDKPNVIKIGAEKNHDALEREKNNHDTSESQRNKHGTSEREKLVECLGSIKSQTAKRGIHSTNSDPVDD